MTMPKNFARALVLSLLLAAPAVAQPVEPGLKDLEAQNIAIATAVQDQLMACWQLPEGYEGRSIAVRLAFLGDGTLLGDPAVEPESERMAGKYPVLMRSIAAAILSCLPFQGLEALGARADESFDITVQFRN